MLNDDEDDIFISDKFDDCSSCRNKYNELICNGCGYGEEFEEIDHDEIDTYFKGRY